MSAMRDGLPINSQPLNQAAEKHLPRDSEFNDPYSPHVLNLALWGLDQGLEVLRVRPDQRWRVEQAVQQMARWKPANLMTWLVSNPEGDTQAVQRQDLLAGLQMAESPEEAARGLLEDMAANLATRLPVLRLP